MNSDQLNKLLNLLTKQDRQKIQDIVDARLKAAMLNHNRPAELWDLSYDLAKVMRVKCEFFAGEVPPADQDD